jgi:rhodanese-related sulfurtransferase
VDDKENVMSSHVFPTTLVPPRLAELLAIGTSLTILDVCDDVSWTIRRSTLKVLHVPPSLLLDEFDAIARSLTGRVVVVCERGVTSRSVAAALRGLGVDAIALEGGMSHVMSGDGWDVASDSATHDVSSLG